METKHITPSKVPKSIEVEVYVTFTDGYPYVVANVVGKSDYVPKGQIVERYVFSVVVPTTNHKEI